MPIAGIAPQLSLLVVLGVGGSCVAFGRHHDSAARDLRDVPLLQPLGSFFGAITSVNQALGALGRIQEVLDLPTETACDAEIAAAADEARRAWPAEDLTGPIQTVDDLLATRDSSAIEFRGGASCLHGVPRYRGGAQHRSRWGERGPGRRRPGGAEPDAAPAPRSRAGGGSRSPAEGVTPCGRAFPSS